MRFASFDASELTLWSPGNLLEFFSDTRWNTLCDLLQDGLILVDKTGIIRYMNAAAEAINELLREQCLTRHLADFIALSPIGLPSLLPAFERSERLNDILVDNNGRRISLHARPVRDTQGRVTCFMLLQRHLDPPRRVGVASESVPVSDDGSTVMGNSEAAQRRIKTALRAMQMGSRVLLLGESGVGKTEFARQVHHHVSRDGAPFVHVNCAGIPESLFESEMFGYERGSFTGALAKGKAGLIESADGGTLFLDEIGETPLALQAKLLQVLESQSVLRLGAVQPRKVQLNVVAATNRDLREMVAQGRFRQDLYFRLSAVVIELPPLRAQRELIDPLIDVFLAKRNMRRATPLTIDAGCRAVLRDYDYLGNIRELQNLVEYLSVVCEDVATAADLPHEVSRCDMKHGEGPEATLITKAEEESWNKKDGPADLKSLVRQYESRIIAEAIRKVGSKRKAAELLGTDIATIVRKSKAISSGEPEMQHSDKSAADSQHPLPLASS